jgi:ElaB/YqjD/DUF883 family membrane-anchored ribosome-binding protein
MATPTSKGNIKDKAQEMAHGAQDAASSLAHKASDAASNLGQKAGDVASAAADKADDAISSVGSGMSSLAGQLRQNAPREGTLGSAAGTVASGLEQGGRYLQEHGVREMADDMTNLVRRYPVQSLLVGFGVGLLLGMAFSRR